MEAKQSDDRSLKGLIDKIRVELTEYVETRISLFKLEAYEKGSIVGSYIVFGLILAFIILLLTIFVLATLAIAISIALKSFVAGFAIVTGVIILMLLLLILNAKSIRTRMTNSILSIISDIEEDD